jgi:hypothetical protein
MRKSLWIFLAVLLVAIGAPNARGDGFTPIITCTGACTPPPFATFTPGAPVGTVDIGLPSAGSAVSLTLDTGDAPTDLFDWTIGVTTVSGIVIEHISLTDTATGTGRGVPFACSSLTGDTVTCGSGTLTFAAVTAPEPSSVALMLLGVGLLFVMRKRIGQGLPQAS